MEGVAAGNYSAVHHKMQRGSGGPLGRHLLPESSADVVYSGAGDAERARVLDLPVAVDRVLAGVLQCCRRKERRGGGRGVTEEQDKVE